jgi:hypothetical protein
VTAYLAHYHYRPGGRSLVDLLEGGLYAGGWGVQPYQQVKRLTPGDVLYVRTTPKDDGNDHRGFVGKALVMGDPRRGEEVMAERPELDGYYAQGEGPAPELAVPIRWLGRVASFEERLPVRVGPGFRGTTIRLREDEPRHVELMRELDELFAVGAGTEVMTPDELDSLNQRQVQSRTPPDPEVEEAGMQAVIDFFADLDGWSTERVEHQNRGWDIEARCGNQLLNIEVKATRSDAPNITISTRELDAGPTRPGKWVLAVLTRATLSEQDRLKWYTAQQAKAVAVPTDYACKLDASQAAAAPPHGM